MPESKDTNPKDAIGIKKAGLQCVSGHVLMALANTAGGLHKLPVRVLFEVGLAMTEGARKYGRHNYRVAGVRASVYYDALVRHLVAQWWCGEDIDKDSGVHHVVKALACIAVVMDSEIMGNWTDDRPPRHEAPAIFVPVPEDNSAEYHLNQIMQNLIVWWEGGSRAYLDRTMLALVELRKAILDGTLKDNRPTADASKPHFLGELNKVAAEIVEKYPDSLPPYTEKEHGDKS